MKVLIITYYWPPAGGSGVQRWLKFVKYFRDFNIEPIVYTVENPSYVITDNSNSKEIPKGITILKQPIFEPNIIFSKFGKNSKKQSAGFLQDNVSMVGKFIQYIRANFFIPDARKYWVKPSVKYLSKYLKNRPVDVIITTGPPHSMHLIGLQLKQKLGIKWISDFRDPWTEIDYFHQLPLSKSSLKKHKYLEKQVISCSDMVIVIGNYMKNKYSSTSNNIKVITNGFDNDIPSALPLKIDKKFSITHIGLMNSDRNQPVFWKVIQELIDEVDGFRNDILLRFVGKISIEVEKSLKVFPSELIEKIDYVSHQEVFEYQQKTQILFLSINNVPTAKGIITGKIFEYLQVKKPILAIGPVDGDAAEIIKKTNAGVISDFDDKESLKINILNLYKQYKHGNLAVNSSGIKKYHRRELTRQLSNLIHDI